MDRYKETIDTWNKIAQLYQDRFMDLDLYDETYTIICQTVSKHKANILEIGCGPGNITKYLLSKRPDLNCFGIDMAPNMIELAKANNPTANFALMDCRDISQLNSTYDAIVCGFCLPYISVSDSEKLLADCYQLLNNKGLLYISFVEGDPNMSGFKTGSSGDRIYFYFHELNALQQQLTQNNFSEQTIYKVAYKRSESETEVHTIIMARKYITQ